MEAKKKEGVSSCPQCCQRIVVWLSSGLTPRARSQHQWETGKKVGSGGSGPCWLSDKESTLLACERGQERYSPVPTQILCNGVPTLYSSLGHHRLRREEKQGYWNGTEPDRT